MIVTSSAARRLLYQPTTLRLLRDLIEQRRTLTDLAAATNLPVSTVKSAIRRMERQGLIAVVEQRPRHGRPQAIYSATANLYYIPYRLHGELLPNEVVLRTLRRNAAELADALIQAATSLVANREDEDWGVLIYADRCGQLVMRPDFASGRTPALNDLASPAFLNLFSGSLMLDRLEAKSLQRELWALFQKYRSYRGSQRYLLQAVVAPVLR
jgi:DNA-binding Lrp family transcriptional regulator